MAGEGNFYPRSPRGERLALLFKDARQHNISIHAPREGSDGGVGSQVVIGITISIHAPREGSDRWVLRLHRRAVDISIHAPREGSDSKCAEK